MAPPYTSYEPLPGGRGYKLYDQEGKPSLYATTPAVEQMVAGLQPYQAPQPLAYNGAGGANAGAPPDATQPPAPAPVAADYGPPPGMAGPPASMPEPNASNVNAPPPAPPPAAAQPRALPGRPPPVGGGGGGAPQGDGTLDPNRIAPLALTPEEQDYEAYENARLANLAKQRATPGQVVPEAWVATSRSAEQRMRPEGDLAEVRAAQEQMRQAQAQVDEAQRLKDVDIMEREKMRTDKDVEFQARQDAATRKFQEETARIEGELEAERKALKNPNDFWDNTTTAQQVGLAIFAGLGGGGGAINGDPEAGARIINGAIDRHVARRRANVEALVAKRGRGKEDFDLQGAALQAERATALRAIDDQLKQLATERANPVLKQLVMEDVPPSEEQERVATLLVKMFRAGPKALGAKEPAVSAEQRGKEWAALTPREKRLVFEEGPNGELVPKENVINLMSQLKQAQMRLQDARENLGYAREYSEVQQRHEKFVPKHTVGGYDPRKDLQKGLKERAERAQARQDRGQKAAAIVAPLDVKRQEAAAVASEKQGARTFVFDPGAGGSGRTEYVARPGTSEKEMQEVRNIAGDIKAMRTAINILKVEASAKNKFIDNPRVAMASKTLAGLAGTTVFNSGIVNPGELTSVVDTANNLGKLGPSGIDALEDVVNTAESRYRSKLEQMGAKPAGGK